MIKFDRLLKKKKLIIFLSLFFLLALANSCMSLRVDDKSILKEFNEFQRLPIIYHTTFKGKTMRYLVSKPFNNKLPTLLFVHGAPGSLSDFNRYLRDIDLNTKANLIAIDRLGYGFSDYGNATTAITTQAESILHILAQHQATNVVLVGWSYGGPIVAKMAVINPKLVKHIFLIAPAISPKDEKYFALGKLAQWKLTRWMVPKVFKVAEDEKRSHVQELTLMLPNWGHLTTPITYYHGDNDGIVPYANALFIKSQIPPNQLNLITIKDGSHFIAFKNYELIKAELLRILNEF